MGPNGKLKTGSKQGGVKAWKGCDRIKILAKIVSVGTLIGPKLFLKAQLVPRRVKKLKSIGRG